MFPRKTIHYNTQTNKHIRHVEKNEFGNDQVVIRELGLVAQVFSRIVFSRPFTPKMMTEDIEAGYTKGQETKSLPSFFDSDRENRRHGMDLEWSNVDMVVVSSDAHRVSVLFLLGF